MPAKKSKNKSQEKTNDRSDKKRIQTLQVVFAMFSIILILSMLLSLTIK
jgi:hypothetical protein